MGVLGAGTMGGGIAYVAADKALARVKDINYDAVGRPNICELWVKDMSAENRSYEFGQKMGLVTGTLDCLGSS